MPCSAILSARLPLVAMILLAGGCGLGPRDIPFEEVREADIASGQPAVMLETGKPVSGRLVRHNAAGMLVMAVEFRDGYPHGKARRWYDNGQLGSEREQRVVDRDSVKVLIRTGVERQWCENGQLQSEMHFGRDGSAEGEHGTWDCEGRQLSLFTYPEGPMKRWEPGPDGASVLVEEGNRLASGQWQGVHRRFHPDGRPAQEEHWENGERQGPSQRWDTDGVLVESGEYRAGKRAGTWVHRSSNVVTYRDYDPANFVNPDYQTPFTQAAGIFFNRHADRQELPASRVDVERLEYYVKEGLVDLRHKLNFDEIPRGDFSSSVWTYAYVRAAPAALETLERLGVDPRAVDSWQRSRLHYCIHSLDRPELCTPEEIERLLRLGLDVRQADRFGNTPLHDLMRWRNVRDSGRSRLLRQTRTEDMQPLVEILLDTGADPDLPNYRGLSPLMLALQQRQFGVARLLLDQSKNPGMTVEPGFNLIHLVFLNSSMNQFELRLDEEREAFIRAAVARGVNPLAPVDGMGTLKDIAERNGAIELARLLTAL